MFKTFFRFLFKDIINEIVENDIENMVETNLRSMDIIDLFNDRIIKIQPRVEESLKAWFVKRIQDGKFPKDSKEYWVCMFCGHIDNKECKYCSQCGAKW